MVKEKLRQAAAFCQSEGAHSVKDIRDFKLVDEFLQALEPLRRIPKAKLIDELKPDKRRQSTKNRRITTTVVDAPTPIPSQVRHEANTEVIIDHIDLGLALLRQQIAEGNEQIMGTLQELRKQMLPPLLATVKQHGQSPPPP